MPLLFETNSPHFPSNSLSHNFRLSLTKTDNYENNLLKQVSKFITSGHYFTNCLISTSNIYRHYFTDFLY